MSADNKKLIPILVILGVLMCGCIAVPVVGGVAMFTLLRAKSSPNQAEDATAVDISIPAMSGDFSSPMSPLEGVPSDFSGGLSGNAKQAAYQNMVAAEAEWKLAQAQYEGAQAVYEQQRNFNNSQAGRLGAQGISLPPPQPPDPTLSFNAQAAQQRYLAAKAEYDALP